MAVGKLVPHAPRKRWRTKRTTQFFSQLTFNFLQLLKKLAILSYIYKSIEVCNCLIECFEDKGREQDPVKVSLLFDLNNCVQ